MIQTCKMIVVCGLMSFSLSRLCVGPSSFEVLPIEVRMHSILKLQGHKRRDSVSGESPTFSRGRSPVRSPIPGRRSHSTGAIDEHWKIDVEALKCEMRHLQGYHILEQRGKQEDQDGVVPAQIIDQGDYDEYGGSYPPSDND